MPELVALVGPTAVGKTDLSIELAKRLNAEIVGCDSMQVYRGMSRLTTQPSAEQHAAVPHHVMSCAEPTEHFSVGQYRQLALAAIRDIQRRGKRALLVGGTGMYLKALQRGLCQAPAEQPVVRQQLLDAIRAQGSAVFHDRLRRVDPVAAAKIHPHDARRIVRALEVFEVSGRPLSSFWEEATAQAMPIEVIGLTRERAELYVRINRRVECMIRDQAVLEEARRLQRLPLSRTALQVHGLRFVQAHLRGAPLEDVIFPWQQQVRNYARRQLIWFRADPRIRWLTLGSDESIERIVDRILGSLQSTVNSVQAKLL